MSHVFNSVRARRSFAAVVAMGLTLPADAAAHSSGGPSDDRVLRSTELCDEEITADEALRVLTRDEEALWRQGVACMREGDWLRAYYYLREAYARGPTWDRAADLALAETQLGLYLDALAHLDDALLKIPESSWFRPYAEERRRGLRRAVTALAVFVEPAGACVEINGREAGCDSPVISQFVLRAAEATVTVRHPDHPTRTVVLDETQTSAHTLEIRVQLDADTTPPSPVPAAITASAGLALIGAGAAVLGAPGALASDRQAAGATLLALGAATSAAAGGLLVWHLTGADDEPSGEHARTTAQHAPGAIPLDLTVSASLVPSPSGADNVALAVTGRW